MDGSSIIPGVVSNESAQHLTGHTVELMLLQVKAAPLPTAVLLLRRILQQFQHHLALLVPFRPRHSLVADHALKDLREVAHVAAHEPLLVRDATDVDLRFPVHVTPFHGNRFHHCMERRQQERDHVPDLLRLRWDVMRIVLPPKTALRTLCVRNALALRFGTRAAIRAEPADFIGSDFLALLIHS